MGSVAGRRGPALAALAAVAALLLARSSLAEAELHEEVERVAQIWRSSGASVAIDKPRFLNKRETGVWLPELPEAACTTVAFVGVRSLGFRISLEEASEGAPERIGSEAGVVSIERCGKAPLGRVVVLSESGRGALEILVGRSSAPLAPLRRILSDRTEGHVGPPPEPGPPLALPSPERRATLDESRAAREGAEVAPRLSWRAGPEGRGSAEATLDAGCHTFVLFAPRSSAAKAIRGDNLDVDAEMRDLPDDHLLARDQADAPDARLATCVGETTRVSVVFVGASADGHVLVTHTFRPLPAHLPTAWGSEVRARMAQTLLARHVPGLPHDAAFLAQGDSGSVSLALSLEPGACYLAVALLAERGAHGIGLSVRVHGREGTDARGADEEGAAVAFCAGPYRQGLAEVDSRGASLLGWDLAVYRLENGIWEPPW
jgi:hypothetical protein